MFMDGVDSWVVQRLHVFPHPTHQSSYRTKKPGRQQGRTEAPSVFSMFCFEILMKNVYLSLPSLHPAKLPKRSLHSLVLFHVLLIPINQFNPRHVWALFKSPLDSISVCFPCQLFRQQHSDICSLVPSYTMPFPRKREPQKVQAFSIWQLKKQGRGKDL